MLQLNQLQVLVLEGVKMLTLEVNQLLLLAMAQTMEVVQQLTHQTNILLP